MIMNDEVTAPVDTENWVSVMEAADPIVKAVEAERERVLDLLYAAEAGYISNVGGNVKRLIASGWTYSEE